MSDNYQKIQLIRQFEEREKLSMSMARKATTDSGRSHWLGRAEAYREMYKLIQQIYKEA